MSSAPSSSCRIRFGLYEVDPARGTLTRNGAPVKIQEQPFRALLRLIEKPGEIVSREELRQKLWPEGTFVDFEGSLNVIFKRLRAALDDDHDNPRFIETVPRKGYRFIAPVKMGGDREPVETLTSDPHRGGAASFPDLQSAHADVYVYGSRRTRGRIVWITAALLGLAAVVTLWMGSRKERHSTGAANPDSQPRSRWQWFPFRIRERVQPLTICDMRSRQTL